MSVFVYCKDIHQEYRAETDVRDLRTWQERCEAAQELSARMDHRVTVLIDEPGEASVQTLYRAAPASMFLIDRAGILARTELKDETTMDAWLQEILR